jgi:hypothetical protein
MSAPCDVADPDAGYYERFGDILHELPDLLEAIKRQEAENALVETKRDRIRRIERRWVVKAGGFPGGYVAERQAANDA